MWTYYYYSFIEGGLFPFVTMVWIDTIRISKDETLIENEEEKIDEDRILTEDKNLKNIKNN